MSGATERVNLQEIPLQQLVTVKSEADAQVRFLNTQYQTLIVGRNRFQASREAMEKLHNAKDDKMLVPMTDSAYHEGTLVSPNRFIVDVGGGFFIERNYQACYDYFGKRIKAIENRIEEVGNLLKSHQRVQAATTECLKARLASARPQQQPEQE